MVKELSKQQRKVIIVLLVAILLGAGRLGFGAFSRGAVEVHLVAPGREGETTRLALTAPQQAESGSEQGSGGEPVDNQTTSPPVGEAKAGEPVSGRLDPNTATSDELKTLPGIGPVLAARIIEYREQVGKFVKIDDLLAVKGIGEKTLAKIRPYLQIKE